ncbi:hypothetical protein C3915_RS11535 [Enterococcus faecalis]|uniref:hypothetical protein n=1 Tax=Enterococcus faecalis TaxID=1351 RepID=UPI000CF296F0|nr:hypothetical protein [Enterococcus faecalis]EGO8016859.1 hypothetical protein [Enterococcus faecalis]EHU5025785.1 hypothetical protein [Enterococcus faecalis]MCB8519517.1 hypothetical protein [Enterococcus faecalis]MDK4456684.1 hypothetical protein [Enterococcus faecalis]PQE91712.1 hypothetical protein CUS91_10430 [Enterococcus faecalis]
MKQNKFYLILLLILFTLGQLQIARLPIVAFNEVTKEGKLIKNSKQKYFIQKNTLWKLREIPSNSVGIIESRKKEVNYVYIKVDIKKWQKKKDNFTSKGNKILKLQKKVSFGGANPARREGVVSELIGMLSGKLVYGQYLGKNKKKNWFK